MIKTTKRKPVPEPRKSYPFRTMAIGESFDVPLADRQRTRSAATQHQKRAGGVRFTGRIEGKVYRMWRIA
jgi:hypothetical protein